MVYELGFRSGFVRGLFGSFRIKRLFTEQIPNSLRTKPEKRPFHRSKPVKSSQNQSKAVKTSHFGWSKYVIGFAVVIKMELQLPQLFYGKPSPYFKIGIN
jgi:hypothetical protein